MAETPGLEPGAPSPALAHRDELGQHLEIFRPPGGALHADRPVEAEDENTDVVLSLANGPDRELRIQVYYGRETDTVVIVLCGGDKRSQPRNIERAEVYWRDHRSRNHEQQG